jgi:hypothetical protein
VAALVAFRWWEGWDQNRECTGIFADCFNESVAPLWIGVPVLLLFAWLGLFALRVERRWLVMVLAGPLNALAAVAVHAVEPRFIAVAVVSSISWGIGGLAAPNALSDLSRRNCRVDEH